MTGLVATAAAAAHARRADIAGDVTPSAGLTAALSNAMRILGRRVPEETTFNAWPNASRGTRLVCQAATDIVRAGMPFSALAAYWSLFWLKLHREAELSQLCVPVAAVDPRTNKAVIRNLRLVHLASWGVGLDNLMEHPGNTLLRLGQQLLDGLDKAWRTLRPATFAWRLEEADDLPQDGDSLSGAAAVAFNLLLSGKPVYQPGCIVLGTLAGGHKPLLKPVGGLQEKLDAAQRANKAVAVVGTAEVVGDPAVALGISERLSWWKARGLTVEFREALGDAAVIATGAQASRVQLVPGRKCLRDKYLLEVELGSDEHAQVWLGSGTTDYEPRLIKLWPYGAEQSADVFDVYRTLWDRELRTMYRVCSSPGADECLLKLRDAGVDQEARAFVMILEGIGLQPLSELIAPEVRNTHTWLRLSTLAQQRSKRLELWRALGRIAGGIQLLHEQQVMHRNVCAERVYCSLDQGPTSFLLGGFEWSIRIGQFSGRPNLERPWSSPPSIRSGEPGHGFASDWYGFGMLAARLFYPLEHLASLTPWEQNREVCQIVGTDSTQLEDIERNFIQALIEPSAGDRMTDHSEIRTCLNEIRSALETASGLPTNDLPLLCVLSLQSQQFDELENAVRLQGFQPEEGKPETLLNQNDPVHLVRLKDWMQRDLTDARLYLIPDSDPPQYRLKGKRMIYSIFPLEWRTGNPPVAKRTWKAATIVPRTLPQANGGPWCQDLSGVPIRVVDRRDLLPHMPESRDWQKLLPNPTEEQKSTVEWDRLEHFLRCTNQIELVMRQSEIFSYRLERTEDLQRRDDGWMRMKIYERPTQGRVPMFTDQTGKMAEFFQREIDLNTPDCRRVRLTDEDILILPADPEQDWEIVGHIDPEQKSIELQRQITPGMRLPPAEGFIRLSSHFAQMALVRRRLNAIERMKQHSYLMRALTRPDKVFMDVGERPLLYAPPLNRVDVGKQAILQDILRARPIYSLLGPPGTGKTTLVAHLLREILQDDPSAQILVTAQAHGAVDVLRAKVSEEAFEGVPIRDQPISVRLLPPPRGEEGLLDLEGSVEHTAQRLLKDICDYMEEEPPTTDTGRSWEPIVNELHAASVSKTNDEKIQSFRRLIQHAANIVYCTTSAGDLEDLDRSNQSFDWTIIEEAGKVHGYDLALPMRAGHRWLLLGDYFQLPPYRINDFENALGLGTIEGQNSVEALNRLTTHLKQLQPREPRLVDRDWIRYWEALDGDGQERFRTRTADDWLRTFKKIDSMLWLANGRKRTTDKSVGALVGQLTNQYRMHSSIGSLVSNVYYDGRLQHATVASDGSSKPWVLHGYDTPAVIRGRSVVWLDLPWCQVNGDRWAESAEPRFHNEQEIEAVAGFLGALPSRDEEMTVALLSPYNQQVHRLNRAFQNIRLPNGLKPQRRLGVRHFLAGRPDRLAHTVDSFQGNQADIVVISLVRNNKEGPRYGLGFLKEEERMNVLISRAGRLLVLVGSFEFFAHQVSITSPDVPSELRHLRLMVDRLKQMFADGEAVRIPAVPLAPGGKR